MGHIGETFLALVWLRSIRGLGDENIAFRDLLDGS